MSDLNDTPLAHHPIAGLFPMMEGDDFERLVEDIRTHGLREPIWLDDQGRILDGRNRDRACRIAGVPLETKVYGNDNALAFVVSLNLHRRHLNESQRAMIAARLATLGKGRPSEKPANLPISKNAPGQSLTQPEVAAMFNVAERSIRAARLVCDRASPTVQDAIDAGKIAVSDAVSVIDLPPEEQEALVAEVKAGRHKTLHRAAAARRRTRRETPPADLPALDARCRLLVADVAMLADVIEPGTIDCILSDPPYPRGFLPVYEALARTAALVLKPGGSCLVMVGQSYLPEIIAAMTQHLRYHWTVAYLTPGGQATQLWDRKVNTFWKPVLWFVNATDETGYAGDWVGDVARSEPNDNDKRFHHWGQSESGMANLVRRFTAAGETVLDPFLGGGTTGVVALGLNRRFIGSDIDPKAVETSRVRLATLTQEVSHAGCAPTGLNLPPETAARSYCQKEAS